MKIAELIKVGSSLLNTLAMADVKASDVEYIELYDEYVRLKSEGHKIIYIVASLSDVFDVSERTVYNVVKKFEKEI